MESTEFVAFFLLPHLVHFCYNATTLPCACFSLPPFLSPDIICTCPLARLLPADFTTAAEDGCGRCGEERDTLLQCFYIRGVS